MGVPMRYVLHFLGGGLEMIWLLSLIEDRWESGIGLALLMAALRRKEEAAK
jgi:hypothetical protein